MPASRVRHLVVPIIVMCVDTTAPAARAQPDGVMTPVTREVSEQLRAGWRQLSEWEDREQFYTAHSLEKSTNDVVGVQKVYRIHLRANRSHLLQFDTDAGSAVYARSDLYTFSLARRSTADPWHLTLYAGGGDPERLGYKVTLFRPLTAYGTADNLTGYLDDPSFTLTGQRQLQGGLVKLGFTRRLTNDVGVPVTINGHMTVDPSRSWVVLDSTRTSTIASGLEFNVRREMEPGLPPRCRSYDDTVRRVGTQAVVNQVRFEFTSHAYGPVDPELFRLSTYGLPEPPGMPPVRTATATYVWLLVAAAACGVLAVLVRRYTGRRHAARGTR